jgi:hypothetical protein
MFAACKMYVIYLMFHYKFCGGGGGGGGNLNFQFLKFYFQSYYHK